MSVFWLKSLHTILYFTISNNVLGLQVGYKEKEEQGIKTKC